MNHEIVCADCGINVPWEKQYGVPDGNGGSKVVCEKCAAKYGFALDNAE